MAFVGISGRLIDEVRGRINSMCHVEQQTITLPDRYRVTNPDDWFVHKTWGEHLHLMNELPVEWKNRDQGSARFFVMTEQFGKISVDVELDLGNVDLFPPEYSTFSAFIAMDDDPTMPPAIRAEVDAKKQIVEIRDRWEKVRAQVTDFLESCKSLNEAIKLWPDLEHYIPKDDIERMLEKRVRAKTESKAVEALSRVDTEGVMAAAVIARLSGAMV